MCHSRHSLRCRKAAAYFTIAYELPDGTHVPVEEPSTASIGDIPSRDEIQTHLTLELSLCNGRYFASV
jgi:hypothetical protein